MQAAIILSIYGEDRKLLTLKRLQVIDSVASISSPTKSIVAITKSAKAHVDLLIESTSLDDNSCIFKNTCKPQIHTLMGQQLGIKNLEQFIHEAKQNGWIVERYVDAIQDYFCVDHLGQSRSIKSMLAFRMLSCILALTGMVVPVVTIPSVAEKIGLSLDFVLFFLIVAIIGSFFALLPTLKRGTAS